MLSNPRSDRVRSVAGLARRPVRVRTGRLLVEGPQGVREAVRWAPERIVDLYCTPEAAQRYADDILGPARAAGVRVHPASVEVVSAMADASTPQGVIAVVEVASPAVIDVTGALVGTCHGERDRAGAAARFAVLMHQVRDPGNAGTVIRAADAAGAAGVLVSAESVDVTAPKVVRSTAGSLFHVPVVVGVDTLHVLCGLRDRGVRVLAADGSGRARLREVDLTTPHLWVMGNEAHGLTAAIRDASDEVVAVPIHGRAESLNLAMAATVCLYASAGAPIRGGH